MDTKHLRYTNFLLTRRIRRVLMSALIASFFLIAPIIILYTAGFGYDITHNRITHTGVLSIDAHPKDARVYLNEIYSNKDLPLRLSNRPPGVYHLKIEKEGFLTWEKDITISNNQTTYIKDVILVKSPNPAKINNTISGIVEIIGSPYAKNILILSMVNGVYEITAFDMIKNSTLSIVRLSSQHTPEISVSPFFNSAYAVTEQNGKKTVRLIALDDPQNVNIFSFDFAQNLELKWNIYDRTEPLFIKYGDTIQKINRLNNLENIIESTSSVWFVDNKSGVWNFREKQIEDTMSDASYNIAEEITRILDIEKNHIIAQNDLYTILINRENEEKKILDATKYYFNRETGEWWFWNDWELYTIRKNGSIGLIYRGGEKIVDIQLFDPYGTILIRTEHNTAIFNPGYNIGQQLLPYTVAGMYVNIKQRELIFLSAQDNLLYKNLF
ncbi:MAG: PEGA domain-containing protein [Candidatus Magasanikbacteria bacterium]|nr:PEGA domain-containing protein [Candidatus Magasanikbacteria bacterium]